ncbi:MAG: Rpn family recombination-promoting nuclease/putative transposase [Lentisphaeria bacterium]|nr:Rpn family recombination-promoting nuclease/putative transposase [Lentisphaeria bacterium]
MGNKDKSTKTLMRRQREFTDAFNVLFRRAGLAVDMDGMEERDTVLTAPIDPSELRGEWVERANDVAYEAVVRSVGGTDCVLLCVENQSELAYDMPLRNMFSACLQWIKYHGRLKEKNQQAGKLKGRAEFLSGMCEDDLLPPVIVLVLYLGLKPWTGPTRLLDIVDVKTPELRQFMADCPVNVVSLVDLTKEELASMRSLLRPLAKLLQTHGDKDALRLVVEEDPMFHDAPAILYRVYNELTNSNLRIPVQEEHNSMSKALDDLKEEGREEGRVEEREKSIHNVISSCRRQGTPVEQILRLVMDSFGLSQDQATTYLMNPDN